MHLHATAGPQLEALRESKLVIGSPVIELPAGHAFPLCAPVADHDLLLIDLAVGERVAAWGVEIDLLDLDHSRKSLTWYNHNAQRDRHGQHDSHSPHSYHLPQDVVILAKDQPMAKGPG